MEIALPITKSIIFLKTQLLRKHHPKDLLLISVSELAWPVTQCKMIYFFFFIWSLNIVNC